MYKKGVIDSRTLMFSVAAYYSGTSLLSAFSSAVLGHEAWLAAVFAIFINLFHVWLYILLIKNFPGKNIIEISIEVFGNFIGRIFGVLYFVLFFSYGFLNINVLSGFITENVLPYTPPAAVLALFIAVCCYAAKKGPEVLLKYAEVFFMVSLGVILFNSILLLKDVKLTNFLPMFSYPVKEYVKAAHTQGIIPSSGTFLLLMYLPNVKDGKNIKKALVKGTIIGWIIMVFIMLRDVAILGAAMKVFGNPTFETIKMINVANFFTRMEILYAVILIMMFFFQISTIMYCNSVAIAEVFTLKSYEMLTCPLGVLILCFSLISFESSAQHAIWGENYAAMFSTFFDTVLPIITIIAIFAKKFTKKRSALPRS